MGNFQTKLGCVCKRRKRTIDDKDTGSRQYSSVNIQETKNTEVGEHTYSSENSGKPEVKKGLALKCPSVNSGELRDTGEESQKYSPENPGELVDTETLSHISSVNSEEHSHRGAGAQRYSPKNCRELVDTEILGQHPLVNSEEQSHSGAGAQSNSPGTCRKLVDTEILSQHPLVNSEEQSHRGAGAQKYSPGNCRELVDTEILSQHSLVNSEEQSHRGAGAQKYSPGNCRELVDTENLSQHPLVNSEEQSHRGAGAQSNSPGTCRKLVDTEILSQHPLVNSKEQSHRGAGAQKYSPGNCRELVDTEISSQHPSVNSVKHSQRGAGAQRYSPENCRGLVDTEILSQHSSVNSVEHSHRGAGAQRYSPENCRELVKSETLSQHPSVNSGEHSHRGAGAQRYSPENCRELVNTVTLSQCSSFNSGEHSHRGAEAKKYSPENSKELVDTETLSQCSYVNSGEHSHRDKEAQRYSQEMSRELVDTETLSQCSSVNSGENSYIGAEAQKHSPENSRDLVDTESQYPPVNSGHPAHSEVLDSIETGAQKHTLLNSKQKEKLRNLFQHIISNAQVDFSNREFKDIRKAVNKMLARIRDRVNMRGIFDIASVVPTGSTVEYTSLWKFGPDPFLEFDFLARLINSIQQRKCQYAEDYCQGCIKIEHPPVRLDNLRQYCNIELFNAEYMGSKIRLNDLFVNEINQCLTVCGCLSFNVDRYGPGNYTISLRPSRVNHKQNCKKCTLDMPTGTLHINSEMSISPNSIGPNKCSLIFKWQSKINSLSAPDSLLLQRPQPMTSMPIHVDFIPALAPEKVSPSGAYYKHDYFIVPKRCNVCHNHSLKWRKSWCMTEVNVFKTEMSVKHKNCYRIFKYFSETIDVGYKLSSYHIKTLVLRHHTKCSDTTKHGVDCLMEIIGDLHQAYETKQLLGYKTNLNMLGLYDYDYQRQACEMYINKLRSVSEGDTWETFIAKMQEITD